MTHRAEHSTTERLTTELLEPIDNTTLDPHVDWVHENITGVALGHMHTDGVSWEPVARSLNGDDQAELGLFVDAYDKAARAKAPAERDGFDTFLLAMGNDRPDDIQAPEGSGLTAYGYYRETGDRIATALKMGKLPEGFEDVATLEKTTAYLLLRGLVNLSSQPDRSNPDMRAALAIMREATQRVPGFDPMNAGLWHLFGRSVIFGAALRVMPSVHLQNHAGRELAEQCMYTVENVMATLYAQDRGEEVLGIYRGKVEPSPDATV